jgi:hypothetical protein
MAVASGSTCAGRAVAETGSGVTVGADSAKGRVAWLLVTLRRDAPDRDIVASGPKQGPKARLGTHVQSRQKETMI